MFNKDFDYIQKFIDYLKQIFELIFKLLGIGGDDAAEDASK